MSESQAQQIILEVITSHEKCNERKDKLLNEMRKTFNGLPMGLDSKHRDIFNSRYGEIKKHILDVPN